MYSFFEVFHIKKRYPIVFVPGLYGSMGDKIIPGTGKWHFGMAAPIYQPFIKSLEGLGYEENKDLFIAFYDWRKPCTFCAKNYLKKIIIEAKKRTGFKKVNIISHSMGGLVSRAYLQSKEYKYDVDHLIMIGTPNTGATNAYYFWSGGKLPDKRNIKSNIFTNFLEGYLWILEKLYGAENDMDMIHKYLFGAKDLLPSAHYGDYLYFYDDKKNKYFIPYRQMEDQNNFLDYLNFTQYRLYRRRIKVTLIGGKGVDTKEQLQVDKNYKEDKNRWKDGKVIGSFQSKEGDGTVMLKSALGIPGDSYILNGSHTEILGRCSFILKNKLGVDKENLYRYSTFVDNEYISILVEGTGELVIKYITKEGENILYSKNTKNKGVYVEEYNEKLKWILLTQWINKDIFIEYKPKKEENIEIKIMDSLGKEKIIKERQLKKGRRYKLHP